MVDFDDRAICELVYNARELTPNMEEVWRVARPGSEQLLKRNEWHQFSREFHALVWTYLDQHWATFKSIAQEMQLSGKSLRNLSIEDLASRHSHELEQELFDTVRPAIKKWLPSVR